MKNYKLWNTISNFCFILIGGLFLWANFIVEDRIQYANFLLVAYSIAVAGAIITQAILYNLRKSK